MAIGLWEDRLAGHTGCTLTARATASSQQLVAGTTPANTVWPVVTFTIPLTLDENNRLACGSNAMDEVGSGVTTDYSPITGAVRALSRVRDGPPVTTPSTTPPTHPIRSRTECPTAPGTVRLAQSGANLTMTFGAASAAFVLPGATAATVAGCCAENVLPIHGRVGDDHESDDHLDPLGTALSRPRPPRPSRSRSAPRPFAHPTRRSSTTHKASACRRARHRAVVHEHHGAAAAGVRLARVARRHHLPRLPRRPERRPEVAQQRRQPLVRRA